MGTVTGEGCDSGGGGRFSTGVGVLDCCALRACRALRRISDLGATEYDAALAVEGRAKSGVDGRGEDITV